MSKLNIYENKWNDLVFENRNKEYGAYQLRQENPRTTVNALFMGLLLITALGSIPVLISKLAPPPVDSTSEVPPSDPIVVTPYNPTVTPPPPAPPAPPVLEQTTTTVTDAHGLVNPIVVRTEDAVDKIAPNTDNVPVVQNNPGTGDPSGPVTSSGGGGDGPVMSSTPTITNTPVLPAILDKQPAFPGGIGEFYKYVGNNFRRPELDMEKTLKVYVSFVVEKDGSLTDIIVQNDPGYGMGKEAVRVLKSLKTKWSPGILDGKPVRTAYSLPITIKTEVE